MKFRDLPPAQRAALRAVAFRGVAFLGNDTITGARYTSVAELPAWALHRKGLVTITDREVQLTTSGLALVDSTKIKIVP